MMTTLAALSAGCSAVMITDVLSEKLALAARYAGIAPVNGATDDPVAKVRELTEGWGADVVFEASGHPKAFENIHALCCPGGALVLIGMPPGPVPFDVVAAQVKELRVEHVFRCANIFPRAVALLASGKTDLKPLISRTYPFRQGGSRRLSTPRRCIRTW